MNDAMPKQFVVTALDQPHVEVRLPTVEEQLDQDQEWCEVSMPDGEKQRVLFHDYATIYQTPGFYEALFYRTLKCTSPMRVVNLLTDVLTDCEDSMENLSVLDVGAGNGMVGEQFWSLGAKRITGVDIIEEARDAALRDRPHVYRDYYAANLLDLDEETEKKIRSNRLNCLTIVAALGFGDIPAAAFVKAMDLIETPAWMALNIKENFLYNEDDTGFARTLRRLQHDRIIRIEALRRYQHRLSMAGEPLHYVAVVAKKLQEVPDHYLDSEPDA